MDVYSWARPVKCSDVGLCYYCGCEAEFEDFAPPKDVLPFYLKSGESCSYAIVPTCIECMTHLKHCREGTIENRKKYINKCIERKYKKALNIYERWNEEELKDLSEAFVSSIRSGIKLGEEAYKRLKFLGFEYEIDGNVFHARRRNIKEFLVFGEKFDNFRNALQYASRKYSININKLKEWLIEYDAQFDVAINAYFENKEKVLVEKEKERLSKDFAKKYKQNSNFIKGALEAYMKVNPSLTIERCLELIYKDRITKD